jgi:hypothetical protein
MGMSRATYERRFRELFAEAINLVDGEVNEWRKRKIEVRKNQVGADKLIYVVEWKGQALNAFALELRKDASGYPYIVLHTDYRFEVIYQLHRIPYKKEMALDAFRSLLFSFIEDTILAEAKRIALQEGFFAAMKGGDLFVPIGNYEFRLRYYRSDNVWRVRCDELKDCSWVRYECGDQHPLEFFPHLLRALALRYLL